MFVFLIFQVSHLMIFHYIFKIWLSFWIFVPLPALDFSKGKTQKTKIKLENNLLFLTFPYKC